jgi:hypothetical protein
MLQHMAMCGIVAACMPAIFRFRNAVLPDCCNVGIRLNLQCVQTNIISLVLCFCFALDVFAILYLCASMCSFLPLSPMYVVIAIFCVCRHLLRQPHC